MKRPSSFWFGSILILIGVLLLLDTMDVVSFSDTFWTYWPVLLIIWGIARLFRPTPSLVGGFPSSGGIPGATTTIYPSTQLDMIVSRSTFGDFVMAAQSQSFSGGTIATTFGSIDLDLMGARLAPGDHTLTIDATFGNAIVQLPKEMPFALFARTTFGRVHVGEEKPASSFDYRSPDFDGAPDRIRILVKLVLGNITVRR
jgi:hypothetical protein